MIRTFLVAAAGALLLAAPATAGGWATAGLGPPDDGISAGDTWKAEVMIKQHGITPLVGATPAVIITKGSESHRFPAEPTGKAGVYVANVKFPSGGTWRYQVYDGFTQYGGAKTHSFAPIQVAGGGGTSGLSVPEWTWGLVFAALGLGAIFLLARRSRPAQAPVAQP